jgi:hypothetical protein
MDDRAKIRAVLRHIHRGQDFRDFPGTKNEKLALVARIARRRLVKWERERGRYRLTWIGRWQLGREGRSPTSLFSAKVIAATCAALTIAAVGFWTDASVRPVGGQTASARPVPTAPPPPLANAFSESTYIGPAYSGERQKTSDQPSAEPGIESAEPPHAAAVPAKPVQPDATPSITQPNPKKKIAKRRHRTYVSRQPKNGYGSAYAYTGTWQAQQHQYFNGTRGAWSSFR